MIALSFPATPWRGDDPRQETTGYDLTWDGWTRGGWGTASATSYVHWREARAMNQMINGTFWSRWTLTINQVLSWKMYLNSHYKSERQTVLLKTLFVQIFKKIESYLYSFSRKCGTLTHTGHKEKWCILFNKSWSLCEIPVLPLDRHPWYHLSKYLYVYPSLGW